MKTLLILALSSLSLVSGYSQAVVQFQNGGITFPTPADRLFYLDRVGGTPLVGTNYAAALYYRVGAGQSMNSPSEGTQAGGLAFFRQPTTTAKGIWLNPASVGNTRTLDGVLPGMIATLQVRVWDITKYASFASAFAGNDYGWSAPFDWKAPLPGDPPNASYMDGLRAGPLCLECPEPSTLALSFVAGLGFLFWNRSRLGNAQRASGTMR